MAFPCINVGQSEETKADIDRDAAGGEFTAARSDLVGEWKEYESQDKDGARAGSRE